MIKKSNKNIIYLNNAYPLKLPQRLAFIKLRSLYLFMKRNQNKNPKAFYINTCDSNVLF